VPRFRNVTKSASGLLTWWNDSQMNVDTVKNRACQLNHTLSSKLSNAK